MKCFFIIVVIVTFGVGHSSITSLAVPLSVTYCLSVVYIPSVLALLDCILLQYMYIINQCAVMQLGQSGVYNDTYYIVF